METSTLLEGQVVDKTTIAVFHPRAFIKSLLNDINNARKSILVKAMTIDYWNGEADISWKTIIDSLIVAQDRLRRIDVQVDGGWFRNITCGIPHIKSPLLPRENRERIKGIMKSNATMAQELLSVSNKRIIFSQKARRAGPFGAFAMAFRDHRKIFIIDKSIVYIGGQNMSEELGNAFDIMVKINSAPVAEQIYSQFITNPSTNTSIKLPDGFGYYLTDAGQVGKSIIMAKVREMIANAQEKIVLCSQYKPYGLISKLEEALKRGVEVEHILPYGIKPPTRLSRYENYNPKWIREGIKYHTKALVVDGEQVLVGSHNFTNILVYMGTKENAWFVDGNVGKNVAEGIQCIIDRFVS